MATDLLHRIGIAAPAERIYRAITTEEGIKGWWTTDVKMDTQAGGKAMFGFENHSLLQHHLGTSARQPEELRGARREKSLLHLIPRPQPRIGTRYFKAKPHR